MVRQQSAAVFIELPEPSIVPRKECLGQSEEGGTLLRWRKPLPLIPSGTEFYGNRRCGCSLKPDSALFFS